jgi:hypothetical protein
MPAVIERDLPCPHPRSFASNRCRSSAPPVASTPEMGRSRRQGMAAGRKETGGEGGNRKPDLNSCKSSTFWRVSAEVPPPIPPGAFSTERPLSASCGRSGWHSRHRKPDVRSASLAMAENDPLRTFSSCGMKPCEQSLFQAYALHAAVLRSLWRNARTGAIHFARSIPMARWRVVSDNPRPSDIRVISYPHPWCPRPVSACRLAPVVAWGGSTWRYPVGRIRLAIRCQQLARTWLQGRSDNGRGDRTHRRRTRCRSYRRREKSEFRQTRVGAC